EPEMSSREPASLEPVPLRLQGPPGWKLSQALLQALLAAELLVQQGQLVRAREHLRKTSPHHPGDLEQALIAHALGSLSEQEEAWPRVSIELQRAILLLNRSGVDAPGLEASLLNTLGVAWLEQQKWKQAEQTLEHALRLREALFLRAQAREPGLQGLDPSALERSGTQTPLTSAPNSAEERTLQVLQARLSSAQEATSLEEARRWLANTLYNLGVVQARQEHWREAIHTLEQAATHFSGAERLQTQLDLARLLHEGGARTLAQEVLRGVDEEALSPAQRVERQALDGLILAGLGQVDQGLEQLKAAIAGYAALELPLQEGQLLFNLGLILAYHQRREEALDAFAQARVRALELHDTASVLEIDRQVERLEQTGAGQRR
ncbi:MAG: hypothetical protein ACKO6N_26525, partial [Myxococcota bacterium]